ncbi:E3 ubiquitin-protein ligase ubr1 [Clarireedia jacksonii]
MAKVVLNIGRSMDESKWSDIFNPQNHEPETSNFGNFCCQISHVEDPKAKFAKSVDVPVLSTLKDCQSFVQKYILIFLRKVTILMNIRYGVAFNNHISSNPDAGELERLSEALGLPTFDEICSAFLRADQPPLTCRLLSSWIEHANSDYQRELDAGTSNLRNKTVPKRESLISVSHPAIFELIGLPKNYDTLMEETMKRRCPTTGRDIQDPMLCLFCRAIFCGQSICCARDGPKKPSGPPDKIGGAQQHMYICQKNIGLFINIRKCCVFYMHQQSGSWMVAPYIDKYGEVDPGLRHSRQLYLNQKRYDALLRTVWLGHGVPSVISRKLEMDINNGGWETI